MNVLETIRLALQFASFKASDEKGRADPDQIRRLANVLQELVTEVEHLGERIDAVKRRLERLEDEVHK